MFLDSCVQSCIPDHSSQDIFGLEGVVELLFWTSGGRLHYIIVKQASLLIMFKYFIF